MTEGFPPPLLAMAKSSPRRTALVVAVIVLTLGGAGLTVGRKNSAAQDRIEQHVTELRAELAAVDHSREAVWGETVDGQAWTHYEAALATITDDPLVVLNQVMAAARPEPLDPRAPEQLLARFGSAHEQLATAAHCRDASPGPIWREAGNYEDTPYLAARILVELAVLRLVDASGPEAQLGAVRCMLDAQQFARDLASAPPLFTEMLGAGMLVPSSLDEHLSRGLFAQLTEEAQREWLGGLRALEASLSVGTPSLAGELEFAASRFADGRIPVRSSSESSNDAQGGRLANLKGSVLRQVQAADHLDRLRVALPEIQAAFDAPAGERLDRLRSITGAIRSHGNPVTERLLPSLAEVQESRLYCLARLSFLRRAFELHLGEDGVPPLDPYGFGVDVEVGEDTIRVGSERPPGEGVPPRFTITLGRSSRATDR